MNIEYHKWWSSHLSQDMELKIYGCAGKPVVVFPTQGGRFYEYEDFGMVEVCRPFVESGKIQLYTVDSVDSQSWATGSAHPADRARRHEDYDRYITQEVAPFIRQRNPSAGKFMATGCSMGAYHAPNFFFRHPDLFDAVIALSAYQIGTGGLQTSIHNLARSPLPPQPPSFAEVVQAVEQIEGVRFAALFGQLPARAPDGDSAIARVWEIAVREQVDRETGRQVDRERVDRETGRQVDRERVDRETGRQVDRERVLAQMPEAVRTAIEAQDVEALTAALQALPPEQAEAIVTPLREAGIIRGGEAPSGPDMEKVLQELDPLLRAIAAVARGDDTQRAAIEEALPQLEQHGCRLMGPVIQLWHGECDEAVLTEGLDDSDARLVRRILEYVAAEQRTGGI